MTTYITLAVKEKKKNSNSKMCHMLTESLCMCFPEIRQISFSIHSSSDRRSTDFGRHGHQCVLVEAGFDSNYGK